jgi:hypothetical protein
MSGGDIMELKESEPPLAAHSEPAARRCQLPKPSDRLSLGKSGLKVSPFCLGRTAAPETVVAAYEAGINFFFVSADLHWPLYEGIRTGLAKLFEGNPSRRNEIVVGVVSYLDEPLFSALQFDEVIEAVPGLERVDLLIAGAVSSEPSFFSRLSSLQRARANRLHGAAAIGASFHQRPLARIAGQDELLDISYVRFNSAHPGARTDLFPYLRPARSTLVFNFKSMLPLVTEGMAGAPGLPAPNWRPEPCDYYRFVLSRPELDGVLCSPMNGAELRAMVAATEKGPLSKEQEDDMIWLSSLTRGPVLT